MEASKESELKVADIIKELGYNKINLLGLSMGGMIAQEVTRLNNDLVEKLILVGTGPRDGEGIGTVTSTTFKFMLKAGINRVDPKRFIFYNHDEKGKIEANKVLDRLASRSKENTDADMKVPSFLRQLKAIKKYLLSYPERNPHTLPLFNKLIIG